MDEKLTNKVAEICKGKIEKVGGLWSGFKYQMLGRLISDCDYYLGNGNRNEGQLWACNALDQLEAMKAIYNSFTPEQRPEWFSADDLQNYKQRMLNS